MIQAFLVQPRWIQLTSAVVAIGLALSAIVWIASAPPAPPPSMIVKRFECTTPDGVIAHDVWWWRLQGDRLSWTTGQDDLSVQTLRRPYSCRSWRLPE